MITFIKTAENAENAEDDDSAFSAPSAVYFLSASSGAKDFYRVAVGQEGIEWFDLAVNGRLHIPSYRQTINNDTNCAAHCQCKFSSAIWRQFLAQNAVKPNLNLDIDVSVCCSYGSQLFHTSSWASTQA